MTTLTRIVDYFLHFRLKQNMSYYIRVSGESAGKFLTVDQEDYEVKVVEVTASNDNKWNMEPLNINELVVRHDVTHCYL